MKGYYFFFFLSACLGILFINTKQVLFIGLNVLLLLYMYKKASIQPVLIMVGCFLFFCFYKTNSPYHLSTTYQSYQVKVKEVKETYCIVNYKDKFILLYTEEQEIFPNDLLSFEANLKKISKDSQLVGFEFQNYLKNKRVYYQFENINNFQILQRSKPLSLKITNFILSNLSNESQSFIALLLFNDRYIDPLAYDSLLQINALHLFVVSGFHFVFLFQLFNRIFSLFLKNKASYLSFCILFFYLYLLNFSISAFRSLFCLFFTFIDKKHRFTALDGLAFSGFILFLFEPLSIFNLSFIMSYSLAFILILSKKILKDKSKITQSLLLSFIAFMIMIPIQLSINYKINFISFFSNILLSPIVLILFIFSLLSICLSFINGNLFSFIYRFFLDKINTFANQTQLLIYYDLRNLTFFEKEYVLPIFSRIFGSANMTDKLTTYLRIQNSLCYYCGFYTNKSDNYGMVYVGLKKDQIKKAKEMIFKAMKEMSEKQIDETYFGQQKEKYLADLKIREDDIYNLIDTYYSHEIMKNASLDELKEEIPKVTLNDIQALAKKMELAYIYILEEGEEL